jgi:hypothetical protein
MDESTVRGIILGVVFMAIGLAAHLFWRVLRSPSEGARRVRWVVGGGLVLFVGAIIVQSFGIGSALMLLAALAVITWVVRGFRKS